MLIVGEAGAQGWFLGFIVSFFYAQHWKHLSFGCIGLPWLEPVDNHPAIPRYLSIYPYLRREYGRYISTDVLYTGSSKDLTVKHFIGALLCDYAEPPGQEIPKEIHRWLLVHWSRYVSRSMLTGFPLSDNPRLESLSASSLPAHLSGRQLVREQPRSTACASLYVVGRPQTNSQGHPSRPATP